MSTLDVVIAIPLIPLAPILITWWLPWERWIPWGKLPKSVLGPYCLYAAFAAWHFKVWWALFVASLVGLFLCLAAVVEHME